MTRPQVVIRSCSPSEFEDRWSIEDWIHSKRRNRIGQDLLEILVRVVYIEESLSDDEDGNHGSHTVFLTPSPESESEVDIGKYDMLYDVVQYVRLSYRLVLSAGWSLTERHDMV